MPFISAEHEEVDRLFIILIRQVHAIIEDAKDISFVVENRLNLSVLTDPYFDPPRTTGLY